MSDAQTMQQLARQVGSLESEVAALRQEITRLQRTRPAAPAQGPSQEQLRQQSEAWAMVLGMPSPGVRPSRPEGGWMDGLESAGLRFVAQHGGKLWLLLAVLAVLVVTFRDRLA